MAEVEPLHFVRETTGGVIFCQATPLGEVLDDPAEVDLYNRGYLWCQCFTPVCPQGEGAHVHTRQLVAISPEAFEEARRSGWHPLTWA
ncbi:MAG: hypothetical protein ACYDGR_14190 [Candidatus Dormibacteria bacterium]